MWVSGVYEKMAAILHHGQTKSGWIHSRYTYDALLFAIGLPAALAAASLASQTARTSLATQLAAFVFVALFSLAAFRLAFSAVKWLLPVVEFTGLPQPLHRQIRLALSTIVLGSVGSLGATLIWFVLYGSQ
jgi:hypothetical protein